MCLMNCSFGKGCVGKKVDGCIATQVHLTMFDGVTDEAALRWGTSFPSHPRGPFHT